jgi:aldehyde:ferredoxin oxidoreductase
MMGGYIGKLLRVDLTKEKIINENLPEMNVLRKFCGGVGLATKIAFDEVPPTVQALDPENRIIFMTGPLTGTIAPASSRYVVLAAVNHNTPKALGTAWGGGKWAAWLKFAGFDGVIVQGGSEKPAWLWIHNGEAELRDASKIWGRDTHETERLIKDEIGDPDASVLCIGPAGENMIKGALISNDRNHAAAKSGGGAVLGAKKLKAIAISGEKCGVPLSNPKEAIEVALEWRKLVFNPEGGNYASFSRDGGTPRKYKAISDAYVTMAKNLSDPGFGQEWTKSIMDTVAQSKLIPKPCFNCPVGCPWDLEIGVGPKKGYVVTLSGGAENMEGPGCNLGVLGGESLYLTDLCDRLGLDASTAGGVLSLAFECYNKGLLTKDKTDGLELIWGNADAAEKLFIKMVKKEGFGKILEEGQKALAEYIGGDAYKFMTHVKGSGLCAHDLRRSWEILLGELTSSAPGSLQGMGVDQWGAEPDIGYPVMPPHFVRERTVPVLKMTQLLKQFGDCLGICRIASHGFPGTYKVTINMLNAVVESSFTREEAELLGERVTTLMRLYNLRRGLSVEDDFDFGPRLLEAPDPPGPKYYKSIEPYLNEFIHEYYKIMGWDEETGIPTKETLKRLGLEEYINTQSKKQRGAVKSKKQKIRK